MDEFVRQQHNLEQAMTPQPSALAALQRYERRAPDGGNKYRYYFLVDEVIAAWPAQAQEKPFGWAIEYPKSMPMLFRLSCADFVTDKKRAEGIKLDAENDFEGECKLVPLYTHPSPSTAADDPNTCVLCKCRLPDAALREALSMLRECVEGEFGLQAWVDTYPCDHTPKLIERARTLLAGDNRG